MSKALADLIALIKHHLIAAGFGSGALLIAALSTTRDIIVAAIDKMPVAFPKTLAEYWTWMRDTLQAVFRPKSRPPKSK